MTNFLSALQRKTLFPLTEPEVSALQWAAESASVLFIRFQETKLRLQRKAPESWLIGYKLIGYDTIPWLDLNNLKSPTT